MLSSELLLERFDKKSDVVFDRLFETLHCIANLHFW